MRELIIILLVVLVVFGAKKLRTIGSDLGAAVRGFKKGLDEGDTEESLKQIKQDQADADFNETKSSDSKSGSRNG